MSTMLVIETGININTNTEMTDMTKLEVGQKKNLAHTV